MFSSVSFYIWGKPVSVLLDFSHCRLYFPAYLHFNHLYSMQVMVTITLLNARYLFL